MTTGEKLTTTRAVSAIILFGDPSHVANATYNRGTADNDGVRLPVHRPSSFTDYIT